MIRLDPLKQTQTPPAQLELFALLGHTHPAIDLDGLAVVTPLLTDTVVVWRDGVPKKATLTDIKTLLSLL